MIFHDRTSWFSFRLTHSVFLIRGHDYLCFMIWHHGLIMIYFQTWTFSILVGPWSWLFMICDDLTSWSDHDILIVFHGYKSWLIMIWDHEKSVINYHYQMIWSWKNINNYDHEPTKMMIFLGQPFHLHNHNRFHHYS